MEKKVVGILEANQNLFEFEPLTTGTLLTIKALLSFILVASTVARKQALNKGKKACSNLSGLAKEKCSINAKINALKKQSGVIYESSAKCSKTKNPHKCKKLLISKSKEIDMKIKKLKAASKF